MVHFPLVPLPPVSFSFRREEVKQPHCRDAQRPNIMHTLLEYFFLQKNFLRHQITCHLPPCPAHWPSKTTVARTSKLMLVVHGAGCPSKILQDRYLAKLMARRRISFAICYITFKTRISFKEHMKRCDHLLAPQICQLYLFHIFLVSFFINN